MAEQDNLRLAREVINASNAHNPERLAKLTDEKFVGENDTLPAPTNGPHGPREFTKIYVTAFPDGDSLRGRHRNPGGTFQRIAGWAVLWSSILLAGCGSMQSTPQQEATWDAMRACDHFPGVWIDRVEADGRYWVKENNAGNLRLFQDCVAKYRAIVESCG